MAVDARPPAEFSGETPGDGVNRPGHIPGAVFVDLERDLSGPPGMTGRHPLPEPTEFGMIVEGNGVRPEGVDGAGEGPGAAYMLPRPRDFTQALYQIRTTPSGALPTDADIQHVIDYGMPGTAMPGWRELLSRGEREALVDYLKTFSAFFDDDAPAPIDFGRAPGASDERLAEGRALYERVECWKCHGQEGRGDGQSAPTQTDDNDFPIRPADLTENWLFNGGGTVEDIYRRFRTGLDGTPSLTIIIDTGGPASDEVFADARRDGHRIDRDRPRSRGQRRVVPRPRSR